MLKDVTNPLLEGKILDWFKLKNILKWQMCLIFYKKVQEKEKILVTSIFYFSHKLSKKLLP